MRTFSRLSVLIIFFLPLFASLFYFSGSVIHLFSDPQALATYWTPYLKAASLVSLSVGVVSTVVGVLISFFVGYAIFSFRNHNPQRFISFFLSVPHLAFFSGVLFLISPSGLLSRVWSIFSDIPFYGMDRDPWALSFSLTLALKESLFLVFVLLPSITDKKNEPELIVSQSFGHTDFTYWSYVLWPRLLQSLRYPIWIVIAYSLSVVDLAMVLAPTNPPPFSVVLWEFFQSADVDNQMKSVLGSLHILVMLVLVILIWELIGKVFSFALKIRLRWPIRSESICFRKTILGFYFFLLFVPLVVLGLWAVADEWVFPNIIPSSFTYENFVYGIKSIFSQISTTVILAFLSSMMATCVGLIWLEWDRRATKDWLMIPILFVPVFPIVPLLFGFDVFLSSSFKPSSLVAVFYVHLLLVFPYVFIILKSQFMKFDERYKVTSLSLGQSVLKFFLTIRVRMLLSGILTAFSVGFAVSIAQYLPTVFIGGGRVETLTTQMVVAASGENRKWMGVFGILQILIPAIVFFVSGKLAKEKV
tara:strand:- start:174588 stop:176180 length:1593 start_codon:yes stop_codon:yes gene_type:complete